MGLGLGLGLGRLSPTLSLTLTFTLTLTLNPDPIPSPTPTQVSLGEFERFFAAGAKAGRQRKKAVARKKLGPSPVGLGSPPAAIGAMGAKRGSRRRLSTFQPWLTHPSLTLTEPYGPTYSTVAGGSTPPSLRRSSGATSEPGCG